MAFGDILLGWIVGKLGERGLMFRLKREYLEFLKKKPA